MPETKIKLDFFCKEKVQDESRTPLCSTHKDVVNGDMNQLDRETRVWLISWYRNIIKLSHNLNKTPKVVLLVGPNAYPRRLRILLRPLQSRSIKLHTLTMNPRAPRAAKPIPTAWQILRNSVRKAVWLIQLVRTTGLLVLILSSVELILWIDDLRLYRCTTREWSYLSDLA